MNLIQCGRPDIKYSIISEIRIFKGLIPVDTYGISILLILALGGAILAARQLDRRRRAKQAVQRLAREMGTAVRKCLHSINGEETREASFTYQSYSVRIGAGSAVSIDMQGFESSIVFALGAPNFTAMMNQRRDPPPLLGGIPLFINPAFSGAALEWLATEENARAAAALECSYRERLTAFQGGIQVFVRPEHAMTETLSKMVNLAKRLEKTAPPPGPGLRVDGLTLDPDRLPADLRALMPLIKVWAVGDDAKRRQLLERAGTEERERLIREVGPLMGRINAYLDSFPPNELPAKAILAGRLAEAVAELGG
jgi:hypothetical protein